MACVVNGKMVFFQPEPRYKEIHKFIAIDAPDEKRDLESVVWKYVLGPLRDAGIPSVFGPLR